MKKEHFMLFSSCVPVKGAVNSAIYDLERHRLLLFPSIYFDVLEKVNRTILDESIVANGWSTQRGRIEALVQYLIESEVAFFTDDPAKFPPISEQTFDAGAIHNAIIDVDAQAHDFNEVFTQLDALGCEYVQVRGFSPLLGPNMAVDIANAASHKSIRSVELLVKYDPSVSDDLWKNLVSDNKIISRLVIHSAAQDVSIPVSDGSDDRKLEYLTAEIRSADMCGVIQLSNISAPSMPVYLELKRFNGCLNKKISIASDGSIRNCPSMRQSFGDSRNKTLQEVVAQTDFRHLWGLKKDDILVCKDCEFRYACTDCRAYLQESDNELSKPAKCGYDPYSGTWRH